MDFIQFMADRRTGSFAKKSGHGTTAGTTITAGNQPLDAKTAMKFFLCLHI
jgi:hypothetical protein